MNDREIGLSITPKQIEIRELKKEYNILKWNIKKVTVLFMSDYPE